jgi:large subunit ribosomal protein L4
MKAKVYNLQGKETGEIELSDAVFDVKIKPELVHEVFVAQMNNQRESWADTKNRGEVRGGGKKPWKQKGTGRARHGSTRSPIWKGGGVAFGPLSIRNYKTKINKKTRRLALKMCLSDKLKNNAFWVVDDFNFSEPKTKLFAATLQSLPIPQKSYLVLTPQKDEQLVRMARNLSKVKTEIAQNVSVMDLLSQQAVIISKEAIMALEKLLNTSV